MSNQDKQKLQMYQKTLHKIVKQGSGLNIEDSVSAYNTS